MTPPMHKRVKDYFVDAGITDGFITQLLMWQDSGNLADAFMVFRPGGGGAIDEVISSEYHVSVYIIGAKGANERVDTAVQNVIEHIKVNPMASSCLGQITNMGGIPAPMISTEGRLIYRLMFACLYGE
ncbi:hypothetical protein [Pantoea sp. Marseille-Q5743]|uniref:phage tail termination protein n=1 Tax=Pantoea sp. Marseille-Q5743 TaxID=2972776 RepID=UPI0021C9992F|nr:hypothetical protein [Pantoea sp. Marseille-Q5743]